MKKINIEDFKGIKAEVQYKKVIDKYGKKTKDILIATSPDSERNRATPYRLGWVVHPETFKSAYRNTVWNETNWQLTHLLENGHFITNHDALAWSPPQKHIRPAYDRVKDGFMRDMKKVKVKFEFK